MTRFAWVFVLCILVAFAAYAKGPVAPSPEDVSTGYAEPILAQWGLDVVTWTTVASSPQLLGRSGSGVIGNYFYCFGGEPGNFAVAFNLTTQQWENSTPPPLPQDNWCGVVAQGSLYLIGRYDPSGAGYGSEIQKFTPTGGGPTGTWTTVANYPIAACGIGAAYDGVDYIYAAGGNPSPTSAYKYSISANTWTPIASLPISMAYTGGAFVNGKFYVYGGTTQPAANSLYEYNPDNNTWTQKANVPTTVWFSTFSTTYNDGLVMSIGGGGGYGSWPATNAVQLYDPATDTWTQETPLPIALGANSARWAGAGVVISAGGYSGSAYTGTTHRGTDFPGGADPLAPAAPTNFTVSNNGATLTASLAWTNPTTTVNGQPLTSITNVIVKRGETTVATLTGNPGQAMTYNDNVPAAGMYNYSVYCTNAYGDGLPANGSAWIGLDTPGPVTNLTGAGVGTTLVAELNWTNPTAGAHGGYWPAGSITGYVINRYGPSNATFNITGITTTYTDNTIPVQGWYHYGVIAVNQSGNGPEVMTGNFYVGPPEFASIPYNWVEISGVGTNTGITGDDQNLGPFPIGFGYNHYGTTFTDIRVCSNGWASFTSTSTAYTNAAIPNTAEPNNLVAPLWDDLYPPGGGVIYYYYDQANSRFIIEWDNVMSYVTPRTPQKFEVILYPNGDMDFMYHTIQAPCVNANTVGKENAGGTVGVQVTYNGSGPLEPASNTGIRIYGAPPVTPNVTITLTPINPPIQIPATGGSFNFDVNVANGESTVQSFAAWIMVQLPNMNWYGPVLGPINLTLPGGASITRNRSQTVPASAPAGNYLYEGRVGVYPATIWDTGSFPFTKLSTGDGTPVTGWENTGESFDQMTTVSAPSEFVMIGAYPNPFNPSTTISFALPTASRVTLNVYDISGRQVATLANGWRDAGVHEVVFDGSNLASGIYIYTLTAGDQSFTGKMVMMK
jgi:hypothetical protein